MTDVTQPLASHWLRSFGSNTPPLGAKLEFSFAKLFSKASKIPRLLAAGIFLLSSSGQLTLYPLSFSPFQKTPAWAKEASVPGTPRWKEERSNSVGADPVDRETDQSTCFNLQFLRCRICPELWRGHHDRKYSQSASAFWKWNRNQGAGHRHTGNTGKYPFEKQKAKETKTLIKGILNRANEITLHDIEREKYFRIVASVIVDGQNLSDLLLAKKLVYCIN